MRPLLLILMLLLQACASVPEPVVPATSQSVDSEIPENQDLVEAELALGQAKSQLAEWMVMESSISRHPVTLTNILRQASALQKEGKYAEASRLAHKVIQFARLGLQQILEQGNALPFYPQ